MVENSYYVGNFALIAFFYYVPNFRWVQATVTSIEVIALFYLHLVPESIRWNIVKGESIKLDYCLRKFANCIFFNLQTGRYDEARRVLREAAQMKYENVDPEVLDRRIDRLITHFEHEEKKQKSQKKPNIWHLWRIPKVCIVRLVFDNLY